MRVEEYLVCQGDVEYTFAEGHYLMEAWRGYPPARDYGYTVASATRQAKDIPLKRIRPIPSKRERRNVFKTSLDNSEMVLDFLGLTHAYF